MHVYINNPILTQNQRNLSTAVCFRGSSLLSILLPSTPHRSLLHL